MKNLTPADAPPCDCASASTSTSATTSTLAMSPLRSVAEVATMLGVHPRRSGVCFARGELVARRIGRSVRVSEHDLQGYLDRC